MGKRKNKVVDLKAKQGKVSEDELNSLRQIVGAINSIQTEVGKLEAMKHQYLHNLSQVNDKAKETQDSLKAKYGTYDVNLQTGELNITENDK